MEELKDKFKEVFDNVFTKEMAIEFITHGFLCTYDCRDCPLRKVIILSGMKGSGCRVAKELFDKKPSTALVKYLYELETKYWRI